MNFDSSNDQAQNFDIDDDGEEIESGEFDYDISGLDCEEFLCGCPSVEWMMQKHFWISRSSILAARGPARIFSFKIWNSMKSTF